MHKQMFSIVIPTLNLTAFLIFFREAAKLEIKVLEKIQQRDRNGRRYWYCLDFNCILGESANSNCSCSGYMDVK